MTNDTNPGSRSGATSGSDLRAGRTLDDSLASFDLEDVLADLDGELEEAATTGDRDSMTLVHRPEMRVVVTRVADGAELRDQASDQGVAILGIDGSGELSADGRTEKVERRRLASVAAGTDWTLRGRHDLVAVLVFSGRTDGQAAGGDR